MRELRRRLAPAIDRGEDLRERPVGAAELTDRRCTAGVRPLPGKTDRC